MSRVFVTGIGALTSFGKGIDNLYRGLVAGVPPIKKVPDVWRYFCDTRSDIHIPFNIEEINRDCFVSSAENLQYDPVAICSIEATLEAIISAGFHPELETGKHKRYSSKYFLESRVGTILGTGVGGITSLIENAFMYFLKNLREELSESQIDLAEKYLPFKQKSLNKFAVPKMMPNSLSDIVAMKFGAPSFVDTVCQACSSSTTAIGRAYQLVKNDHVDIMITGGSEYLSIPYFGGFHKGFDIAGTLALGTMQQLYGPFDQNRSGFIFSNGGAASLILESEESMLARGVEPLVEIIAFSENFECHSLMALEPTGHHIAQIHKDLLGQAAISPEQIDYINTHGTGTVNNDEIEANVLATIYGRAPYINSTKGILGHTIGASGAIEAVSTILQMKNNIIHGNANLRNPIKGLNLPAKATHATLKKAISTSFAFGGHNAGLLMEN